MKSDDSVVSDEEFQSVLSEIIDEKRDALEQIGRL